MLKTTWKDQQYVERIMQRLGPSRGQFLPGTDFYQTQVSLGSDIWVPMSVRKRCFWNFADVTLADQATKSIPTDNEALSCGEPKPSWESIGFDSPLDKLIVQLQTL